MNGRRAAKMNGADGTTSQAQDPGMNGHNADGMLSEDYPKRQMGNKMYGGESSHLPLKINQAGVIPAIFASALLLLPVTFSNFSFSNNETFLNLSAYTAYYVTPLVTATDLQCTIIATIEFSKIQAL